MSKKRIHVLSNTHWDREHRHGFQETRMMLVELMDELIEIMENDADFKYYTLDGQAVMVDDYLEIKPEMRERLAELIKSGRILIGPWYSLCDAFAVNPEAVVRNLLIGDRFCRQFGEPMKFGYSIFSFGQIAQLPQIYAGFGIDNIIFYKGFSQKLFERPEFIWQAPDGTKALTSKLTKFHRVNFFVHFTVPVILGGHMLDPGWSADFNNGRKVAHPVDRKFYNQHAKELEPDIRVRQEKIREAVENFLDEVSESSAESVFLGFDGIDFSSPLKEMPEALRKANEIMGNEVEFVHSWINDYINEFRSEVDLESLMEYEGELRFGPVWKVHSESMSANVEIKQRLAEAESLLINYAEPLTVFNWLDGGDNRRELLYEAWKHLLQAHCHDSVHGLGVPKLKTDVLYRIDQVKEICESLTTRALQGLTAKIDTSLLEDEDIIVTIFNPSPYMRSEVVELVVDLPRSENVVDYWLEEINGTRIEHIERRRYDKNIAVVNSENRPKSLYCDRVELFASIKDVPPMGYKSLWLKRVRGNGNGTKMPFPPPKYPRQPIAQSPEVLDNGLVRVEVAGNGTVTVKDLKTGHEMRGLNSFVDCGCAGDMWVHREPELINTITSTGIGAKISVVENSRLRATVRVEIVLDLPVSLNQDRKSRSQVTAATSVVSEITVKRGTKRVDFKTMLDNQCSDHKLSAVFPTGIHTDLCDCECPFEVRKRPVNGQCRSDGREAEHLVRQTMKQFVDVSDGKKGVAIFSKGLMEFESCAHEGNGVELKLTLLRAVTQTFPLHEDVFCSFDEEPSQCRGRHVFEYAILPHKGDYRTGAVLEKSRRYNMPLAAVQYGKGAKGHLPLQQSFFAFKNSDTVLICVKLAEDRPCMVIRLNNSTDKPIKETIEFYRQLKEVYLLDLNENRLEQLKTAGCKVDVVLEPFKILTLEVGFVN